MKPNRICDICNNTAIFLFRKIKTDYFQCTSCATVFSGSLNNENMVGGGNEEQRNKVQNQERIERIGKMLGGYSDLAKILDFGCGHGMFVADLNQAGFCAEGYDVYNPEFNKGLPKPDKFHVVTMVEVIEHLSAPYFELDVIYRSLKEGGAVYIETSFVDVAHQEGIPLEEFFYIAPEVGHSTIFSHHGLDVLMLRKGFIPMQHGNRHVRIYLKPRRR